MLFIYYYFINWFKIAQNYYLEFQHVTYANKKFEPIGFIVFPGLFLKFSLVG